ncbi:MAG: tyrosine-type recombinase/integrase [Sphaerospermopsis kisseleviana]
MKPNATSPRKLSFVKVLDGRKQPIRGLWKRGENFYAQLQIDGKTTWPKLSANTTAQAVEELNKLKVKRREGTLNVIRHAPKLSEAIEDYKQSAEFLGKRPSSQSNEKGYFKLWTQRLGHVRVDKIQGPAVIAVRDEVHGWGRNARTCNLYVGALMQVLKFCRDRGKVARLPELKRLKQPKSPRRTLLEDGQFGALLDACRPDVTKHADIMRNFLRFLALSGARDQEAARLQWEHVHFDRRKVTIGADGLAKNREARDVDMTDELFDLLQEMHSNRVPDSSYLFPSPQRVKNDKPISNMRNALEDVRTEAGLPEVAYHHMRDLFISKCVMAGVPFMTIAAWVGHKDGGVLIGKVYGHLSQDHKAEMAKNLSLFKQPANVTKIAEAAAS